MYADFKELLSVLNAHSVKYLVVGAYAVSVHAQPRATKDLDIWVNPDAENAKALYGAGAGCGGYSYGALCKGAREFQPPRQGYGKASSLALRGVDHVVGRFASDGWR